MTTSSTIDAPARRPAPTVVFRVTPVNQGEYHPYYAFVEMSGELLSRIERLHAVAEAEGLTSARAEAAINWEDGKAEGVLRDPGLGGELVVLREGVFFFSDVDGDDWDVETVGVSIADLKKALSETPAGNPVFMTEDSEARENFMDDSPLEQGAAQEAQRG